MVSQQYTESETNNEASLPLYDFFIALKQQGFLVTPAQIADSHSVIAMYSDDVANETELCDYLSPIFSNSEEEQVKFKELFERYFKKAGVDPGPTPGPNHWQKHWWKYLLALIAIVIAGVIAKYSTTISKPTAAKTEHIYLRSNYEGVNREYYEGFNINKAETLKVYPQTKDAGRDSIYNIQLNTKYDWGDSSKVDTSGTHLYGKQGNYQLKAFVDVYYGDQFRYADTLNQAVRVCDATNKLTVKNTAGGDSIKVGEKFKLTATVEGSQPDSILWFDEQQQRIHTGSSFDTLLNTEMFKQLTCIAVYDSVYSPCSLYKPVYLVVYDPNKPVFSASVTKAENANPVGVKYRVKGWLFLVAGLIFVLSFAGMILFSKWRKKKAALQSSLKEEADKQYNELVSAFAGKKPPFDLPFRNKNSLPLAEPVMNEVAWQMRRRIDDDVTYLHLQKTIQFSVSHAGFFQPVKVPRTHQSEYLVLIDESDINNQQVKLVDYAVDLFRKQNVFIDKFYYRRDPSLCYNINEPAGLSLEKLSEKYPGHVLLIFGNGHQFIYEHYPVINQEYLRLLKRWTYKAIITPLPLPDWGLKEKKVLIDEIPVLPVDAYGQLLLMHRLFGEDAINIADLNEYADQFYKTADKDFEEVDDLFKYCEEIKWARQEAGNPETNILFQWIAALTIYPRIRWEIILAIGKSILEKYGKPEALNFTVLLRIARIKWMSEGRFPDYTRLELLKYLQPGNEIVARETLLSLLKEIPEQEINADHFVYEEKEIQRIINEFNLYAYDPLKYADYAASKEIFKRLWNDKKILDAPAKVYLKNGEKKWNTLVNKVATEKDASTENIKLEEYLEQPKENAASLKGVKLWTGVVISLLFFGSLLALVFLLILNFLNTNKLAAFTYKKSMAQNVAFIFRDSTDNVTISEVLLSIDTTTITLKKDSAVNLKLPLMDSARIVALSVNGKQILNSPMILDQDAYSVLVNARQPVSKGTKATLYLAESCTAGIYDYKSYINDADNNILINDSIVSKSATMVKSSSGDCINQVSYGSGVDQAIVKRIIGNFKNGGIVLTESPVSPYLLAENEIAIYYYSGESKIVPVAKPVISIQISDESLRASATAFKSVLQSAGYTVGNISMGSNTYNSRIGYYKKELNSQALAVQQLYKKYYPALPIPVNLITNTRGSGVSDNISIWIRKLDDALPLKLNSTGQKVSELQGMLIKIGYANITQSGVYDEATQIAVKQFQTDQKMAADGIVGAQVWAALIRYVKEYESPQTQQDQQNVPNQQAQQQQNNVYQGNNSVVDIANKEVGYTESPAGSNKTKYGQWYGAESVSWSGIFVSWVYNEAGKPLGTIESTKGFASFEVALKYFSSKKMITQSPQPGDIVIIRSGNRYTGGIFIKWNNSQNNSTATKLNPVNQLAKLMGQSTDKVNSGAKEFEMIAGNNNEKGATYGERVVSLSRNYNAKTTYFIHVTNGPTRY